MATESENKNTNHFAYNVMKEAQEFILNKKDEFIKNMKDDLGKKITDAIKSRGLKIGDVDNILVAAIVLATNESAERTITKLLDIKRKLKSQNVDNLILEATFYNLDTKYLFGSNKNIESKDFPRRLDKVTKLVEVEDSGSKDGGDNSGTTTIEVGFNLDWNNINSWDWPNFIEPLSINFTGNQKIKTVPAELSTFAKICYTYVAIRAAGGNSSFDSLVSELGFPFFEDQLIRIYYTSPFGPRNMGSGYHFGIDLAGTIGEEVHAAADGVVFYAWPADGDGGGNRVAIKHMGDIYTIYMHLNDFSCSVGQQIMKGQVIGHLGNTGMSTGPHLHFQIGEGGVGKNNAVDPVKYFSRLGSVPDGVNLGEFRD